MTEPRVRLVVLFGGRSAEHEVSCVSAVHVLRAVDPERYDVVPIGITHDGRWVLAEGAQKMLAAGGPAALPPALEATGPEIEPLEAIHGEPSIVVLPLLHGPFGEDGTVQGLCELAGVPYVGAGVLGSAVCMDKITTRRLARDAGLPTPRWLAARDDEADVSFLALVADQLGFPVFVKPSNLGSSVGVTKASTPEELRAAVDVALAYDEWVLVDEAVTGREIECEIGRAHV